MKRQSEENGALVKRSKQEDSQLIVKEGPKRTSNLQAPIMLLTGHNGAVFSCRFSPSGSSLVSSSFDQSIFLWNVYNDCQNYNVLKGHKGAVLEVDWSRDGSTIVSAATDKTGSLWDAETGQRIKKLKGHTSYVNACAAARRTPHLFATSSDDGTIKLWDPRVKIPVHSFTNTYQVTSVCFNEGDDQVFSGGIDNVIKVWDLRKKDVGYTLVGHTDTVTGLKLSPDGSYLLSNSMDNTLKLWDVKPFAKADRLLKQFEGAPHGNEKQLIRCSWSSDGSKICAGSGDRTLVIWDVHSKKILYRLPGHKGVVIDSDFHPKEPIVASAGADKQIFLGEVEI